MRQMKRKVVLAIVLLLTALASVAACGRKTDFKVDFIVDGNVYATIRTSGEEVLKMPDDPTKDGYIFDGWFWDEGSWKKPFTANSLLDAPLSSNMSVYAKWEKPRQLSGTDADFSGFLKVSDTIYTMKVSNATETLSMEPLVTVHSHSTWVLTADLYADHPITSKTAALTVGDNTYYVLVTGENGQTQLYTLKIRRRAMYEVTLDTNGGAELDSVHVEEDEIASIPTPERTGYTFAGWDFNFSAPITQNVHAVASWTANQYWISYRSNGGTMDAENTKVTYDAAFTLSNASRNGYAFEGWYADGVLFTDGIWDRTADLTLEAKWKLLTYSLTYDLDGGTTGAENPTFYTVEDETIRLTNPTREYYIFAGWTGTGLDAPTLTVEIPKGSTEDRTYTANWTFNGFRITYNLNGGDSVGDNVTEFSSESATFALNPAIRRGFNFEGWYTSQDLSEETRLTEIVTGTTKDITLYAKWSLATYRITYDANGGVAPDGNPTSYTKESADFALLAPTRKNYEFIGWFLDDECVTALNGSYCRDLTLTAKWKSVYLVENGTITGLTDYGKTCSILDIPENIDGKAITAIGDGAFSGCSSLTEVIVPNSVTHIGKSAFAGCTSLISITVPFVGADLDGVANTHFGYIFGAADFSENRTYIPVMLRNVTVTGGTKIGWSAFYGMTNLKSLSLPFIGASLNGTENTHFGYIFGADTYSDNSQYVPSSLNTVVITGGKSIDSDAFRGCSSLTSITIGNSVTSIGNSAFSGCSSLTSITIPDSVTSIGDDTFSGCSSLTSITIPDSVTSIGDDTFSGCGSLTSITIPNSVTSIGNSAFSGCSSLTSIMIPDSVTSIGFGAFSGCGSLTSIMIPDSVTSIGFGAFSGCGSLTSITIPFVGATKEGTSNTHFGYIFGASSGSYIPAYVPSSLKTVMITGGKSINSDAFRDCRSLESIMIPDSVTSIGHDAFYNCRSLKNVYITDLTKWCSLSCEPLTFCGISLYAMYEPHGVCNLYLNGTLITDLVIPDGVTSIGCAFAWFINLTSITIPSSVTSIGNCAFSGCDNVTSITVLDGNTKYHSEGNCLIETATKTLIAGCKNSVIPTDGSVTSIGSGAFYGCRGLKSITIPYGVTSIDFYAFDGCYGLESITIPDSVTSISANSYMYFFQLKSITFMGTKSQWDAISKSPNWDARIGSYTVHCTDGDITKS